MTYQIGDSNFPEEYQDIAERILQVKNSITCVLENIGDFKIFNETLVPEGLKPIARSISWLVEQVVIQNLTVYKRTCGIEAIRDPPHNLTQYDCILNLAGEDSDYFVNIKTSLARTRSSGRADISKAEKLIRLYEENPDLILLVAIVKVEMDGVYIRPRNVILFNVAWTPDIYYNRANHNLQSISNGTQQPRTNQEFIDELKSLMDEAGHLSHY